MNARLRNDMELVVFALRTYRESIVNDLRQPHVVGAQRVELLDLLGRTDDLLRRARAEGWHVVSRANGLVYS